MNTLLGKKNYNEAVEVSKFIQSFKFIYILFVDKGIDFAIEDFIEEWGNNFLIGLVEYSCNKILDSTKDKKYYKVSIISTIYLYLTLI